MERGYVQIYTGEGKGKTTAAIGLCLRALGSGLSVYLGQFIKEKPSAEVVVLSESARAAGGKIESRQYGLGRFIAGAPPREDVEAARKGFDEACQALSSGRFDLVVLDELCVAVARGLIEEGEALGLIAGKPRNVELVMTGRYATQALIDAADLVTEMRAVKHYHTAGVPARKGIEL
jgi:cob(I)alamin adenosyltransferase